MPNPLAAAAVTSVATSAYSAYQQHEAAGDAADAQQEGVEQSIASEERMFNKSLGFQRQAYNDLAPWRIAGKNALNKLAGYDTYTPYTGSYTTGPDGKKIYPDGVTTSADITGSPYVKGHVAGLIEQGPGEFTESPGYQFRLDEGEKAIDRAMAARGSFKSGAAMKELGRFNQDYATNDYDNFLNRYYDSLKPYQSLAGIGQTAAGQGGNVLQGMGQTATSQGNSLAGLNMAGADARASGYINQANAVTGGINGATNNMMNMYALSQMFGGGNGGSSQYVSTGQQVSPAYPNMWNS